ncbi:hypothetical protein BCR36DRAFT_584746, partial [Piromyces finnis]
MVWPYSMKNWYISQALAHVVWLSGEIVGDWYPLLRTLAVTKNDMKNKIVYTTCIFYNIAKIYGMSTYFTSSVDLRANIHGTPNHGLGKFNLYWWISIFIMQMTSCLYDISVIYALKTGLFNKLKEYGHFTKQTFMDKFKSISELRIICSMTISLLFLPFLIYFIVHLIQRYHANTMNGQLVIDGQIEQFRQTVLSFNYTMMYIDQILLKTFSDKKNQTSSVNANGNTNNFNNNSDHSNITLNIKPFNTTTNHSMDNNHKRNYSQNSSEITFYDVSQNPPPQALASSPTETITSTLNTFYINKRPGNIYNDSNYYLNDLGNVNDNPYNNNNKRDSNNNYFINMPYL